MKALKKIITVLVVFALFQVAYSGELSVDSIEVRDGSTVSVLLSENPNLEVGEVEDAQITLLHDVSLLGTQISYGDATQVEIHLDSDILPETSYSLLTLAGAEGSIDFMTPADPAGYSYDNESIDGATYIQSIEILDETTLLARYNTPINDSLIEFKLLAENTVTIVEKPDFYEAELLLTTQNELLSYEDYILMMIEVKDSDGILLEFDTGIYDFNAGEVGKTIQDYIDESFENTLEAGSGLVEDGSQLVDSALDNAGNTLNSTIDNLGDTFSNLTESVTEVVNDTVDTLDGTGDDAQELLINEGIVETIEEDILEIEETMANDMYEDEAMPIEIETDEESLDLEAAGDEVSLEKSGNSEIEIEHAAMMVGETPDTGAATWVLIVTTLFINTFYFLSRRK